MSAGNIFVVTPYGVHNKITLSKYVPIEHDVIFAAHVHDVNVSLANAFTDFNERYKCDKLGYYTIKYRFEKKDLLDTFSKAVLPLTSRDDSYRSAVYIAKFGAYYSLSTGLAFAFESPHTLASIMMYDDDIPVVLQRMSDAFYVYEQYENIEISYLITTFYNSA